jgi:electron transport complex protein RnfC
MTTLLTFPKGGVHPPDSKKLTADCAIEEIPIPDELEIILGQHIGAPCTPTVERRDSVTEGQMIGEVKKGLGVPLHAPVSGTIKLMGMSDHPMQVKAPSITIKVDHEASPNEYTASDWSGKDGKELLGLVYDAGMVGIGGAGFPSHVKLSPPPSDPIDTLILNGAECEPYITSDYRQMLEMSNEIVEGAQIILRILGIKDCCIGIEANKPEAIKVMGEAAAKGSTSEFNIKVSPLKVKYPQGSEKQLIQSITGRKVEGFALPSSVGVVVHNVATTRAIYDAVVLGKPLYEKIVTVSGLGINKVGNFKIKVGTKIRDIVEHCGGTNDKLSKIIMGGPMMGFNVSSLDIPITKTTGSILFLAEEEIDTTPHSNCIRCGWCLQACPMGLEPKEIAIHVEAGKGEDTNQFGVFECFECGCCAYVCPAKRPLVQFIRLAKMKAKR